MADIEEIVDGDYKLNFGALGSGENLGISFSNLQQNDNVFVVFSSIEGLNHSAVRTLDGSITSHLVGDSEAITGRDPSWQIPSSKIGCAAIVVNGTLLARIALYDDATPAETCLALPLPISAYRVGEQVQPITITAGVAGWSIYSPYQPTRIVGFNLPTSLKYTADSVEHDFTADGGDYGIEFTTPEGATRIAIFDETFWLYMR